MFIDDRFSTLKCTIFIYGRKIKDDDNTNTMDVALKKFIHSRKECVLDH